MPDEPKKRGPKLPPAQEIIKPPAKTNNPASFVLPEGDNNKYTSFALAVAALGPVDLDNPPAVRERIRAYYQLCAEHDMKPGVAHISRALGMHRQRFSEIAHDHDKQLRIPQESKDAIKEAFWTLESLWEMYMQNGKINPASGIFLGKNNFGYADVQEHVLTPNTDNAPVDVKTLEAKYDELPE